MNTPDIVIRQSTCEELMVIHKLANEIWPITFDQVISKSQIDYMLNMMYSIESLQKQMKEGAQFLIANKLGADIAYASYHLNYHSNSCRLHKLYVKPELHRGGIGKELVNKIKEICVENQNSKIELNVNRFNKAISFYEKYGFKIVKEQQIDIGNDFIMDDYIMEFEI